MDIYGIIASEQPQDCVLQQLDQIVAKGKSDLFNQNKIE